MATIDVWGEGGLEIIAKNVEESIWVTEVIVDGFETANVKGYAGSPQGKLEFFGSDNIKYGQFKAV